MLTSIVIWKLCSNLFLFQPFVGRELFAAGFVSCWSQLNEASQKELVQSLEIAFSSPNIPPEILAALLNLVCISLTYWLFSFLMHSFFFLCFFGNSLVLCPGELFFFYFPLFIIPTCVHYYSVILAV